MYLGEARVFNLANGRIVFTSTAAQAGSLLFGDVLAGSFSSVVAAPELGMTTLQISTPAGETRLLLVDWREPQRPRTSDAGPIVHLSGYDSAEQRFVAVITNSAGDSELAAFEP